MNAAAPYLQIRNISKFFGKVTALEEVSLDVGVGEFLFLLGPSGCGKTTLLRIIAGLEEPSAGQVIQAGADVTHLPPSRRDFGIVFQSYALFPNLTVAQNIAYGLENRRLPRAQVAARVAEMLELVGLQGYEARYPAQLSGGQQQRVALARALALSPGLLLLDEPLSALDARVRARLRLELAALQRQLGVTTIMVTHDQEEALTMADRVAVMDRGRIVQVGSPREVYRAPATPFVADFVGLMNFLPGVMMAGRVAQVRCGGALLQVPDHVPGLSPGREVMVAIRPEDVRILHNGLDLTNILETRVHEVEFLGPFHRLHLRVLQQDSCGCALNLTAYLDPAGQTRPIHQGAPLVVHLPVEALRVYPTQA
jgi:iron(III) transport system ATP-binding protein